MNLLDQAGVWAESIPVQRGLVAVPAILLKRLCQDYVRLALLNTKLEKPKGGDDDDDNRQITETSV